GGLPSRRARIASAHGLLSKSIDVASSCLRRTRWASFTALQHDDCDSYWRPPLILPHRLTDTTPSRRKGLPAASPLKMTLRGGCVEIPGAPSREPSARHCPGDRFEQPYPASSCVRRTRDPSFEAHVPDCAVGLYG